MEELGQYILSLAITALVCGIFVSITPVNNKPWIQLLCGLIITVSLMTPFSRLQNLNFSWNDSAIQYERDRWLAEGKNIAQSAMSDIITQNIQTYIMDKAKELGIPVNASIQVSNDTIPLPVSAELYGDVSSDAKLQLELLIERDLGISKENIRWIQPNGNQP